MTSPISGDRASQVPAAQIMALDRRSALGLAAGALAAPWPAPTQERTHRLRVGDDLERAHLLGPGQTAYLRSQVRGEVHTPIDIWRRDIRIETVDGAERLILSERRDGAGAAGDVLEQRAVFEPGSLRPVRHQRVLRRGGRSQVQAFRFSDAGAAGDQTVADNESATFAQPFDEPMFNFEADMELLRALPWRPGYSVSIPFHQPGAATAARYIWSVREATTLAAPDGRAIDCWVVETDYNLPGSPPARFWLARSTQLVLKMEAQAPDGTLHRKTLLTI